MSGRGRALLEDGKDWVRAGGTVDFTAVERHDNDTTVRRATGHGLRAEECGNAELYAKVLRTRTSKGPLGLAGHG